MIESLFEPKNIQYKSGYGIDNDDIDYDTSVYDYTWNGMDFEIALGKIKYTYSKYGVLFCSIYIIVNDSPKSRIGVFEIKEDKLLNSIDDDGIDMNNGNILIFASKKYIHKMLQSREKKQPITIEEDKPTIVVDDIDDVLKLDIDESQISTSAVKASNLIGENIFTIDDTVVVPALLPEENQADSDELSAEYKESSENHWIESFLHNHKYSILENEGDGDCFFAVIRDAFRQIGKQTTVKKLRALLAKEVDNELFKEYKTLYLDVLAEYQSIDTEMKSIEKLNREMKRRIVKITDKNEHSKLLKDANELSSRYNYLKENRIATKDLLNEFLFMENIDTIEKLQDFVMSNAYWADNWAISKFERVLNIKFIILDEIAYKNGDNDGVLLCGPVQTNLKDFSPDYYIITSYVGNHYRLVTYKNKNIFKYREIPYTMKTLIINKCLERNSGVYYLINDFRNYKSKLGLDADYGEPITDEDDIMNKDLYDTDTVFMFHSKSNGNPRPGKGIGEQIPPDKIIEYNRLHWKKKSDVTYDWRRKLDDNWTAPFSLDGHRWSTVLHYVLGCQYKKGFPDFYTLFSLDSESEIATNIDMAIAASSKSGKYGDKNLRPDNVTVDADYYSVGRPPKNEEARYNALVAKFNQNPDLKRVLLDTKRAKLVKFSRRNDPEPDLQLMKVRKELV